jgi:hypothetical protein
LISIPNIPTAATVRDLVTYLCPQMLRRKGPPPWPPDVFAIAASVLLGSGAYISVVERWPPAGTKKEGCLQVPSEKWADAMRDIGKRWRQGWPLRLPPQEVRHWWRILRAHLAEPLSHVGRTSPLCHALLQLCAAADEACEGVGFPSVGQTDWFNFEAEDHLLGDEEDGSTLCFEVHSSRCRVLPKSHTPQTGITLGSLSHHLSLWPGGDVRPRWFTLPRYSQELSRHNFNLLIVPWPEKVRPTQFQPLEPQRGFLGNMADSFGFFTYTKDSDPKGCVERLDRLYAQAVATAGRIDLIVWPELALDPSEHAAICEWADSEQVSTLAGIGEASRAGKPGKNYLWLEVPLGREDSIGIGQSKHHRWQLDRSQIGQYGLGGQLDTERLWWEHSAAHVRDVAFVALLPWLSLCALVCEDLARQEPVAKLVRTVGPNLVIALLMDGPQLTDRWPGRYATVLADDPGSSVLTLTSVGMTELSRPPGKGPSRTVALWKDAKSGAARQIDLPSGAQGIVLNLVRRFSEEWSADGRSDGSSAGYPVLAGVHPIAVDNSEETPDRSRRAVVRRPRS